MRIILNILLLIGSASIANANLTYSGKIKDSMSAPLSGNHAVKVVIMNEAKDCTLYVENFSSVYFDSTKGGSFSYTIGTGSIAGSSPAIQKTLDTSFTTGPWYGGSCTPGTKRYLYMELDATAAMTYGPIEMAPAPSAVAAQRAAAVGLIKPENILSVQTGTSTTALTAAEYTKFLSLLVSTPLSAADITGDATVAVGGALTIASSAVTTAKINAKAVTFAKIQDISTNKLLGRSTAGSGSPEEITIGSGLSLSSGTLTVTGAGTVTSVSGTSPISVATGASTPVISMTQASNTTAGYLSVVDYLTFTNKGDYKSDGAASMTGAIKAIGGTVTAPGINFGGDTDTGLYSSGAGILAITTAGANRMTFTAAGNVGIGTTSPDYKLTVSGGPIAVNPVVAGTGGGGQIRFYELVANGSNFAGIRAPDALAGDVLYTLPASYGTSGQVMATDGAGNLSFTDLPPQPAAGTTAGSSTAYTVTLSGLALDDGAIIYFRPHTTNGASPTLSVNGNSAVAMKRMNSSTPLVTADLSASVGKVYKAMYVASGPAWYVELLPLMGVYSEASVINVGAMTTTAVRTFTITGARVSDHVTCSYADSTDNAIVSNLYVSTSNTVGFTWTCLKPSLDCVVPAGTLRCQVVKD